jgi:hypothetical protein
MMVPIEKVFLRNQQLQQNPHKCCIGNNRYLAAHELGIKEVPIKIVTSEVPKDLMAATEDYIPTEAEGLPSRARAYEASQK